MKLVVGLGNPGRRYEGTRHNVGFIVVRELAKKYGVGTVKSRFQGETIDADLEGEKALLLTPSTFMNLSGASVLAARDFYKIPLEDMLVVCDDLNLPLAKLRLRAAGSAGGQKGLRGHHSPAGQRADRPAADRHWVSRPTVGPGPILSSASLRKKSCPIWSWPSPDPSRR